MKSATSNLVHSLGLPRLIIELHPEKSGGGVGLGELLYNISATAGASDFKFGKKLGFVKAHHKITCRGKVEVALG